MKLKPKPKIDRNHAECPRCHKVLTKVATTVRGYYRLHQHKCVDGWR